MKAKDIIAANVNAWMQYAADNKKPAGSVKSLATLSGVSRPTIDDIRAADVACRVDNLEAVAKVYGLMAWQLLVPGLQPPEKPILGNEEAIEAEVMRRAARMVRMQKLSQVSDEKARAGPSAAYPFGPLQDARPEPPARRTKAAAGKAEAGTKRRVKGSA